MQVGICPVAFKNPVNGLKYLVRVKKNFSAMVLGTSLRGAAGVRSWSEDPGHRGDHGLSFLPMWTNRLGFDRVLPRWAVGAVVAHFVHTEGVAGSNPASPTNIGGWAEYSQPMLPLVCDPRGERLGGLIP